MKKKNIKILNIGLLSGLLVLSSCDNTRLYSQESADEGVSSYPTDEYNHLTQIVKYYLGILLLVVRYMISTLMVKLF